MKIGKIYKSNYLGFLIITEINTTYYNYKLLSTQNKKWVLYGIGQKPYMRKDSLAARESILVDNANIHIIKILYGSNDE